MGKLEVPVSTLGSLLLYRECRIIQRTVLEMLLVGVLHLDDELLALLILAVHVEDGLAVGVHIPHVLAVEEFHVLDDLLLSEKRVKEVDKKVFVGRSTKNALEAKVGQQADVSSFRLFHIEWILIFQYIIFTSAKLHLLCENKNV